MINLAYVYRMLQEIQGLLRQDLVVKADQRIEDLKEYLCVGDIKQ